MGPDLNAAPSTTSCPSCGANLRPTAQWCSLCHHDLRPAPAPVAPEPTLGYGGHVPSPDPLTAPLLDMLLPLEPETPPVPQASPPAVPAGEVIWPCTACGALNALAADVCHACGSPFLAGAVEQPSLVLPGVGDVTRLSRGQRALLAAAVVLAVVLPLALVTYLITSEPPQDTLGPGGTVTSVAPQAP